MCTPRPAALLLCLFLSACGSDDRGAIEPGAVTAPIAPATRAVDAVSVAPTDAHAHHHDSVAGVALERPPGGGSWATDLPLRQGMGRIHGAMNDALPAFEKGALSASAATALANEVTTQVQYLIANCKLEPAADAQLHIVIGQMLGAADALAKDPSSSEGMPRLQQTLRLYGDYFAHPKLHD